VVLWGFDWEKCCWRRRREHRRRCARTLVAFARCWMSSFGKAVPIAD
jgi:hypothetical protein